MKIGAITSPNSKGQIVIPKHFREELGITPRVQLNIVKRGQSLAIYPIASIVPQVADAKENRAYYKLLKKTQGAWKGDSWEDTRKERQTLEIQASQERRTAW